MDLNDARTALVVALGSTGVRVATDPAGAHAPCLLVGPVAEVEVVGACAYTVQVPVHLVAQAPATDRAVTWLAATLPAVLAALHPVAEVTTATLTSVNVGQGDLPAFEMPCLVTVKE